MSKLSRLSDTFNIKDFGTHANNALEILMQSYDFIKSNKLWKGLFEYRWIGLGALAASILFSYLAIQDLWFYLFGASDSIASDAASLASSVDVEEVRNSTKRGAISGGSKFLLMIVLEIIIFFFSIKTVQLLSGQHVDSGFKRFWKAEFRMAKVMLRSYVYGLILQIICSVVFSIVGLNFLAPIAMFLVYGYFLGVGFLDNYNEQHDIPIKDSELIIRQHFGAAMVFGVAVSIMLLIPIIGPLGAPILAAVSATIYGYQFKIHQVDVSHLLVES